MRFTSLDILIVEIVMMNIRDSFLYSHGFSVCLSAKNRNSKGLVCALLQLTSDNNSNAN